MFKNKQFFVKSTEIILISVKILLFSTALGAQSLSDLPLAHSPGIHWEIISSGHFDVIFPSALTPLGEYTADVSEYFYLPLREDMPSKRPYRFPVVLSTAGVISNGMVSPFPRSSLWFSGPDADKAGFMDSIAHLAVHEGRHMAQFDYMNQSTTRVLSVLFGEAGLMFSWACLPGWLYEGDAVYMETLLTPGGRGRSASFRSRYRAMILSGEEFNFYKMSLGSSRHYLPNHYVYGYHVIRYLRDVYGENAAAELFKTVSSFPLPAIGIYSGVKKLTGKGLWALNEDMSRYYRDLWSPGFQDSEYTEGESLSVPLRSNYVYFSTPFFYGEDHFYIRSGSIDHTPGLYLLDQDGEGKRVSHLPSMNRMDIQGRTMVWDGFTQSHNFEMVNFSDIYIRDLDTGKTRKLTHRGRFYDPAISPSGDTIAAVHTNEAWQSSLIFFDTGKGEILKEIPFTGGQTLGWPSWDESGESLVVLSREDSGKGLLRFYLREERWERVLEPVRENIRQPLVFGEDVYFISDVNGVDAVYKLDKTGSRSLAILRPFGINQLAISPGGETFLLVEDLGLGGEGLIKIPAENITPRSWEAAEEFYSDGDAPLDIPRGEYSSEKFLIGRGSKVHSWGVLTDTVDLRLTKIPLGMIASDPLGTFIQKYWLTWDVLEYTPGFSFRLENRALPVKIKVGGDYFLRRKNSFLWNEVSGNLELSLPLGQSRGSTVAELTPSVTLKAVSTFTSNTSSSTIQFPFTYGVTGGVYTWGSRKSLIPRWGFYSGVRFSHTLSQTGYKQFTAFFRGYVPGLFRNQGLELNAAYEWNPDGTRIYYAPPRGYKNLPEMEHRLAFSAEYSLPLFYPDLPLLGSFLYMKRIRTHGFYDISINPRTGDFYHSAGAELLFDVNLALVDLMDFDIGLRFSFLINERRPVLQFLILGMSF